MDFKFKSCANYFNTPIGNRNRVSTRKMHRTEELKMMQALRSVKAIPFAGGHGFRD